jgi:UDP-N-acetylmuramyl pentapeptide phosphotransferase/UDP-N-acetylglucosamine-1-phosphate transferase
VTSYVVIGMAAGSFIAALAAVVGLRRPPGALMRTNLYGRAVPAILGLPVVAAGAVVALGASRVVPLPVALATGVVIVVLGVAGYVDDRRGREAARGFRGHLRAARRGELTGGIVKLVAGAAAGLIAGALVAEFPQALLGALLVAGTANLFNLLDTAPGRAGKVAAAALVGLVAVGDPAWATAASGTLGGVLTVLPLDLRERGMLGDAGANALGAVVGLGLAASLSPGAQALVLAVVAALNLASERWSFGRAIERVPALRALDRWGRGRADE